MKTTNTVNQPIFDEITYLENKVRQLNQTKASHSGVKTGFWNIEDLRKVLNKFRMNPKKHYEKFGIKEGVCPYYKWSDKIYLNNKVNQLNQTGESHSGVKAGEWTVSEFQKVLIKLKMNILEHFERFGRFEGINAYDGMIPRPGLAPTVLEGEGFIYAGRGTCCFLRRELVAAFNKIIMGLRRDYPDAPMIIVGDASSQFTGDKHRCPGHLTHHNLTEVDIDYPLYSGKGTQYGDDIEDIWENRDPENMILYEDKVNWSMTYELLTRLKIELDLKHIDLYAAQGIITKDVKTQFIIHEKIFNLIGKHISANELNDLRGMLNIDPGIGLNLDRHMHLRLSDN